VSDRVNDPEREREKRDREESEVGGIQDHACLVDCLESSDKCTVENLKR
jgi:hypothetical protein